MIFQLLMVLQTSFVNCQLLKGELLMCPLEYYDAGFTCTAPQLKTEITGKAAKKKVLAVDKNKFFNSKLSLHYKIETLKLSTEIYFFYGKCNAYLSNL